ncbi:hypothetical protein DFJ73DRAFT_769471 [Zopfochytrium polystomum]|nr:hypothetical protein DFJ73DRAFT_769471 [Zopfochytrium polystomum]
MPPDRRNLAAADTAAPDPPAIHTPTTHHHHHLAVVVVVVVILFPHPHPHPHPPPRPTHHHHHPPANDDDGGDDTNNNNNTSHPQPPAPPAPRGPPRAERRDAGRAGRARRQAGAAVQPQQGDRRGRAELGPVLQAERDELFQGQALDVARVWTSCGAAGGGGGAEVEEETVGVIKAATNATRVLLEVACDFSPRAIGLIRESPSYDTSRVNAFVCDLTADPLTATVPENSVDVRDGHFLLERHSSR